MKKILFLLFFVFSLSFCFSQENKPIYIYFYNSNPSNNITINTPISSDNYALDNDFAYFKDEDGYFFLID